MGGKKEIFKGTKIQARGIRSQSIEVTRYGGQTLLKQKFKAEH